MYFIYKPSSSEVVNMVIDENQSYYVDGVKYSIKEIEAQNTKDILDNKKLSFANIQFSIIYPRLHILNCCF